MKNNIPFDFGLNLKAIREKKALSRKQLAALVGCSVPVLGAYENNTALPSLNRFFKLCLALNVSADTLGGLAKHETIIIDELTEHQKTIVNLVIEDMIKR